jgi:CubicO group peptidase (beta-lactamase class C family)
MAAYGVIAIAALTTISYYALFLFTDVSTVARIIVWRDPDTGDLNQFPFREVANAGPVFELIDDTPTGDALFETYSFQRDRRNQELDFEVFLEENDTTAFVVLQGDRLTYEQYFGGASRETRHNAFEITLSINSLLVGIAIDEGLIVSVEDPVTKYIPELLERDERFGRITLRNLLTMSSGIDYFALGRVLWGDRRSTYYSTNLRQLALTRSIDAAPGRELEFNAFNPQYIGIVLERATGRSMSAYLEEKVWSRLGMEFPATWSIDSDDAGFERMDNGFNARAIGLAKIGPLYLNGGDWNGERIVSREWLTESTRQGNRNDPSARYRYGWQVSVSRENDLRREYYAEGKLGQYIYVVPEKDLVFVRFGESSGDFIWTRTLSRLAQRFDEP